MSTIRAKLIGSFSLILFLMIAMLLFVLYQLSETNTKLNRLIDVTIERVDLASEISLELLQITRYEKNIILEKEPYLVNDQIQLANKHVERAELALIELNRIVERTDLALELIAQWKVYKELLATIMELAREGKKDEAFAISINGMSGPRNKMLQISDEIRAVNFAGMEANKLQSNEDYQNIVNLIILLIVLSALLVGFISYLLISGVKKRTRFIAGEAIKIGAREFISSDLKDTNEDELSPVFESLLNISKSFEEITENANAVASGNYSTDIRPISKNDTLGIALKKMQESLRNITEENKKHIWLVNGQNQLNAGLRGDKETGELADSILRFVVPYLNANIGTLYLKNHEETKFEIKGKWAVSGDFKTGESFRLGEGLIGQAAKEGKVLVLDNLKSNQLRISSSLIDAEQVNIMIVPFFFENEVLGVIEIGKAGSINDPDLEFLNSVTDSIGISLNSSIARRKIQELLLETQHQSEELQSQSEELQSQSEELSQINVELEEQAQQLKQQQEELQTNNEELQEQTQELEEKNAELERTRLAIEQKNKEIEISSKYKSEFLANMSHELRTPLNSLLILSKDLADNGEGNLTPEQVESAGIIYNSGQDLLALINEVLDLAKIEAGKMSLHIDKVSPQDLADKIKQRYRHQTDQKGIYLVVNVQEDVPEFIKTDSQRLEQIIKNLLSNAIKFTEKGGITIDFKMVSKDQLAIAVKDTGIGIPEDKQFLVFEAFQQAEGGTSRKYGGTGLGLSISRELAALLGGKITLESKVDEGSVFTVIIPTELQVKEVPQKKIPEAVKKQVVTFDSRTKFLNYPSIDDDRAEFPAAERSLLIIEDDLNFASVLQKQAHERDFKCIIASSGEDGLLLAEKYKPNAIILDLSLPGIDGNIVLAELKANPDLRHIPVHIISGKEKSLELIKEGAVEYLHKPVDKAQLDEAFNKIENFINRKMKNLLIVEDDETFRKAMKKLIGGGDVNFLEASTGGEALKILFNNEVDCIILDLGLPDMSGFDLINRMKEEPGFQIPPIIVNTGRELTKEENDELEHYTKSIIIKGVKSDERLLDETALFLHRTINKLPPAKQQIISNLYDKEAIYQNKKILLVDDDMRNVFALSKVLKDRGMEIIKAENGLKALENLDENKDINLVLMDIMMPEMDGYEAMRRIRMQEKYKDLPIIALTAKAMKEDRQKSIDAGANDYITKPVDIDRLLSLMRIWLSK